MLLLFSTPLCPWKQHPLAGHVPLSHSLFILQEPLRRLSHPTEPQSTDTTNPISSEMLPFCKTFIALPPCAVTMSNRPRLRTPGNSLKGKKQAPAQLHQLENSLPRPPRRAHTGDGGLSAHPCPRTTPSNPRRMGAPPSSPASSSPRTLTWKASRRPRLPVTSTPAGAAPENPPFPVRGGA